MKQCPNCNGIFSDEQLFCPECGLKLEEVRSELELEPQPQEDSERETSQPAQRSNGLVIFLAILLAAAVIGMGKLYSELTYERESSSNYERRMRTAQNELENVQSELEKVSDLIDRYGYGSEKYYAEKSVVVLSVNETKEIPIYANMDTTIYFSLSDGSGISGEWAQEWSYHQTAMQVTGLSAGYYTVEFGTDADSTSFEVLVIVTD